MKIHSNEYKNKLKGVREAKSLLTYNNIIVEDNNLYGVKLWYNSDILKSAMKVLEFDYNSNISLNTEVNYKYGIKINSEYEYVDYGTYLVFKSEYQEDTKLYHITCYDKMLLSMKNYDDVMKDVIITYPITIRDYLKIIANAIGLNFKNSNDNFSNYNKTIPRELYKGLGYTIRDVLDELAQVTASTICISNDGKLEVRYVTETNDTIDETLFRDVNVTFGQKYGPVNSIVLSRSAESDNVYEQDSESIAKNGLTEIKIIDNQIMNFNDRADYLQDILTRLNGFEYYINDFSSPGITYLDLCDRYTVKIGENTYSCIMLNDEVKITQGLEENIYTEMPKLTQTDYTKADKTDRRINQTYLLVDKQNQTIQSVVSQTNKQNEKISQIIQSVDEINSKISDIADITTSGESQQALVNLVKINESEPIAIKIHPLIEDVAYLYPSEFLYPSDNLYLANRIIRFTNTKTNEIFDYKLPNDLLFYNANNYDEFILNYDSKTCQVIKRVGYDKATNKNIMLPKEEIINYEYPAILLTEGDYTISLPGYSNGYLYVQLMASNIYTTQFATKVELTSSISQTKDAIDLEVSRKVGNDEIISKINQTPETITIQASKVNIGGVINAINNNTTTTIDGDKITTGTLNADKVNGGTISGSSINLGNGKFTVNTDGIMNATSGSIAGWNITDAYLGTFGAPANTVFMSRSGVNAYIDMVGSSPSCMFYAKGNFAVDENGTLYAENGYFRGNITGSTITGGSISIQKGNYYFNMGSSTSNPNCSGLNVGYYGIKAYSNITATGFAITDSDTGKSESIGIYDGHGHVHYLTFRGGILTKWEYK